MSTILIVDDTPENLHLLAVILKDRGYKVRLVTSGLLALEAAARQPPDLVLLDVNMPEMNGYEVCERLKADAALNEIPVIFISALNETLDKVTAFGVGGVDYVTKPFQAEEVEARVKTHLELRRAQLELKAQNATLEERVRQRTRQLAEANSRLSVLDKAKSDFLNVISHELRTPLHGLFNVADLMFDSPSPRLADELRELYDESRERILGIVEDAMLLTKIEVEAEKWCATACSFEAVLDSAIAQAGAFASSRKIAFEVPPRHAAVVIGDTGMLVKAIQTLLETAMSFANPGSVIRLAVTDLAAEVHLTIETDGRGVRPDAIGQFFDVLAVAGVLVPGAAFGLRLPVAERIIALFEGSVSVENLVPPGIRFSVRLARLPDAPESSATEALS